MLLVIVFTSVTVGADHLALFNFTRKSQNTPTATTSITSKRAVFLSTNVVKI